MSNQEKMTNSWLDELSELIRKKKEENDVLKKLEESIMNPPKSGDKDEPFQQEDQKKKIQ